MAVVPAVAAAAVAEVVAAAAAAAAAMEVFAVACRVARASWARRDGEGRAMAVPMAGMVAATGVVMVAATGGVMVAALVGAKVAVEKVAVEKVAGGRVVVVVREGVQVMTVTTVAMEGWVGREAGKAARVAMTGVVTEASTGVVMVAVLVGAKAEGRAVVGK